MGICRRSALTLVLGLALFSHSLFAQEKANATESLFAQGLAAYQAKTYEQARDLFIQLTQSEPHNAAAHSNLGLSYYQLGDKGRAIAHFRRALSLDPGQPQAKSGLAFALSQLEIKELPRRLETLESLRESVLQPLTLTQYLALTALAWLVAGWLLLGWLGRWRRSRQDQQVPPPFPSGIALLATLTLLFTFLCALKLHDQSIPRGTILDAKVPVRSAPLESAVVLFELHPGFEVVIREVQAEWVQVTYPGGMTGWIPKLHLMTTAGGT